MLHNSRLRDASAVSNRFEPIVALEARFIASRRSRSRVESRSRAIAMILCYSRVRSRDILVGCRQGSKASMMHRRLQLVTNG